MTNHVYEVLNSEIVKSACTDALENIHAQRNKMLTDYVKEERQKREKWNAHWFVPKFMHRSLDAKKILDESVQGSFAQALHSAAFWAPMRGEECETVANKLLDVITRSGKDSIQVNIKEWNMICSWSQRQKIQRFDFSQMNA